MDNLKLLIYENTGAKQRFLKEVETVKDQADTLISYFETFQDLRQITTLAEFEGLVSDPLEYFDETLRDNVEMRMTGGREPEPSTLAKLFGYERDNYIAVISGLPVTENCGPCKSSRIVRRAGKPAITSTRWDAYKSYLTFTKSGFILNEAAIEKHCERFKTFAESESQRAIHKHFTDLVEILNSHADQYPLPDKVKEATAKAFNLGLSQGISGNFIIDKLFISNLIASK